MSASEVSVVACVNDASDLGARAYVIELSSTVQVIGPVPPGIYLTFLANLDATKLVLLRTHAAEATPANFLTKPTKTVGPQPVSIFPGSSIERVRVLEERPYVHAILGDLTGGDLYLMPLVLHP